MWVYKMDWTVKTWDVGFYFLEERIEGLPKQVFKCIETYRTVEEAREAVNFLNGGNATVEVYGTVYIGTTGSK